MVARDGKNYKHTICVEEIVTQLPVSPRVALATSNREQLLL
jgi:hypothetical protein